MVLNINEPITREVFDKIVAAYNQLRENENLFIYLCSEGGDVYAMEAIIHFLSTTPNIALIGYGELCSAGFDIFFRSECPRDLLPTTLGMAHFTGVAVNLLDDKRPNKIIDKAFIQWSKNSKDDCLKFYSELGFTKKELDQIKKGEDVWFQYARLKEFLNKQQPET